MQPLAREVFKDIATPAYVVDEVKIRQNMEILKDVADRSGARILLAQKAFSMFCLYPLMSRYLSGTTASGLYEAKLGREEFGGEVHVFSPAFTEEEVEQLVKISDHIVFNSVAQLKKFAPLCENVSVGLRVNPECSTQKTPIYDPCAVGSRLGVRAKDIDESVIPSVEGLHFHTLCEQNCDALEVTLRAFEERFGKYLPQLKWINLGGGHHITREDYHREKLISLVKETREKYGVTVYLEPGEACALDAGWLVTQVMDLVENGEKIAILDTSAACHMPDVLEMPYRPPLFNSGENGEKAHSYILSSRTCLAGDVIGQYSFSEPLEIGDRLCFQDMAIYSMVKNNTFNGMPLPDIAVLRENGEYQVVKRFGYKDFKERLS